jgi:hypothetical protein
MNGTRVRVNAWVVVGVCSCVVWQSYAVKDF